MKKFLFSMICTLFPILASAQEVEPYAILIDDGTALEFRYDDMKSAYRDAMDIGPFTEAIQRGWESSAEGIKSVVFNESFADCTTITSTAYWFAGLSNLETFIGLEYLNTSNVTNMYMMFYSCTSLASLDLSYFNTQNVTNMSVMFGSCNALTTITVGSDWTTDHVEESDAMFDSCFNLVGGNGTTFSQMNTDASYAHIDTEGYPGYFTASSSGDEPYWQELNYMIEYGSDVLSQATESGNVDEGLLDELKMALDKAHEMYKEHTASEEDVRNMTEELEWIIREVEEAMKGGGEEEPYAVLSEENSVLTFYYDNEKEARGGMDVGPFTESSQRAWDDQCEYITSVVFDDSFAKCTTITSTSYWFYYLTSLTTITGLNNLNTDNVTDMRSMFDECGELTRLDVSGFNTSNVTDMSRMFYDCESLTIIYAGKGWSTENITSKDAGADMFTSCYELIGGAGTTFDPEHDDYTYARIDEGASNPGYLTDSSPGDKPYAVLSEDKTVLTFYYDDQKDKHGGWGVGPFNEGSQRAWNEQIEYIEQVVFDNSFANCSTITSTAYWFEYCENLTTITGLENLKTDNVTDMRSMFDGCGKLTSLDFSGFNTSNVTNMSRMFYFCESLTTIYAGKGWSTENITSKDAGADMFSACFELVGGAGTTFDEEHDDYTYARIDEGAPNPGYLTDSSPGDKPYAVLSEDKTVLTFYYDDQKDKHSGWGVGPFNEASQRAWNDQCESIKEVVFDESFASCTTITSTSYWFNGFIELSTITGLENLRTDNVTDMSHMFEDCDQLRSLDVSGFNTANVTDMSYMFSYCSLTSLDISGFNTANVTNMRSMFEECSSLTTIYVGKGWSTENISSRDAGAEMFSYCEELVGGAGTAFDEDHVDYTYAHIDGGPSNPGYLTDNSPGDKPYAVLSENNSLLTFYYDDQKNDRGGMDVGPFEDGGRTAGPGWSEFNEQITTVVFDESFANCTTLTSTAYWFYGCENLTTITDFNNLKTDNVTDINAMFSDCHSLTSIDFSSLNLSNVTNMSQVFEDCRTLESVNFRGVNTENVTNMSDLFLNCHNLRTIDLSSFNTRNVTNMSHMFCRCDSLTTIYVGEGWNTENVTESDQMFERSANLVGGLGTTYDENHIGIEYAHIDGGVDNPGYLTGINEREAYFDGLTAWVYGDATLNDAFAAVGREAAVQTVAAIVWEANGELTSEQLEGITNPNLLVYVNEASKAPADVQNVIIDGVAEEIILTDATGNSNFYCPQPFTAKSISYSRDFSQTTELEVSRGWETIALPFDVQSISHESHGNLIPFGGEDNGYHFWLRQLSEQGLERATQIEANKPYLISMPNNTIYPSVYNQNGIVTFSSTDVTVPETNPQSDAYADVTLHAAFQQVEQGSDVYALNVGEARGDYPEGSVFEQNYRDIRPFQAYTTHRAGTRFIPLGSLGGKDGATGINELRVENGEKKENAWYSLDGRRLYVKPTKKGVYVKDGQKIVIK